MKNHAPPLSMAPPFGNEESWPSKGFLLKNPMPYFVAPKCCQFDSYIVLVIKGRCLLSLFERYCILRVAHVGAAWAQGFPNPRELACLLPIQELPRDADTWRVLCMT